MGEIRRTIRIPLEPDSVVIFADELPVGDLDYNDIIDVLRSVLAPLKLWRSCAVEYHRQGFRVEFDQVLTEIIDSLADPCKWCCTNVNLDIDEKSAHRALLYMQMSKKFTGKGLITRRVWPKSSMHLLRKNWEI